MVLFDRYRSTGLLKYNFLFVYYGFAALLLLLSSILSNNSIDNNWTYNLFFLVTIVIISWYFHLILVNPINKFLVKLLLIVNLLLFLKYVILTNRFLGNYNSEIFGFNFLTIVVYSLIYINQLMKNVKE
ncbi:MAG: hypothetical protein ABIN97_10790, partial [Ginsengibacter sp.]